MEAPRAREEAVPRSRVVALESQARLRRRGVQRLPGLPNQPVGQRDEFRGPFPPTCIIGVFDRMRRNATLFVEREDEQPRELFLLGEFEDRRIPAQQHAEALVGSGLRRAGPRGRRRGSGGGGGGGTRVGGEGGLLSLPVMMIFAARFGPPPHD